MDRTTFRKEKRRAEERMDMLFAPTYDEHWGDYYPKIEQVRAWVEATHFAILEEAVGADYHHVLTYKV